MRGFSLIELMIALVIMSILAAVAVPSYNNYVTRSNRSAGERVLIDVANRQERFFLDNRTYTTNLANLGYGASPTFIDANGREVAAAAGIYRIAVTTANAQGYALTATGIGRQASDTDCAALTLNQAGVRAPADCW